jgi:hypothetical protein
MGGLASWDLHQSRPYGRTVTFGVDILGKCAGTRAQFAVDDAKFTGARGDTGCLWGPRLGFYGTGDQWTRKSEENCEITLWLMSTRYTALHHSNGTFAPGRQANRSAIAISCCLEERTPRTRSVADFRAVRTEGWGRQSTTQSRRCSRARRKNTGYGP